MKTMSETHKHEEPQHTNTLHSQPHPLQYFLPGEVLMRVEHPAGFGLESLAKDIQEYLSGRNDNARYLLPPTPEKILTFPVQNESGLVSSVFPATLPVDHQSQEEHVHVLKILHDEITSNDGISVNSNINIKAVSPNWLIGVAVHGPHPPSPGSWPVPAPTPQQSARAFSHRSQNGAMAPLSNTTTAGNGMDVAILDTAPSHLDLEEAYVKWQATDEVISRLLEPGNGKLHVHDDIFIEIETLDYHPAGHRYLMADHGLFVASIVNSIAPDAELHIFRAFTPYGTGSSLSVIQGLKHILQTFRDPTRRSAWRPLVVNFSFSVSIDDGTPPELAGLEVLVRYFFDLLATRENVVIVAAAGNDAHTDTTTGQHIRPLTRYPASAPNVISVGALPKLNNGPYTPASYSNQTKAVGGYMTLGGEPGAGQGVLGVYTSEIPVYAEGCLSFLWRILTGGRLGGWAGPGHVPPNPPDLTLDRIRYKPNTSGWAWWAGTSFATPVIAGILAKSWSTAPRNGTPLNFATAIAELDQQVIQTVAGEQVIHVNQG